MSDIKQVAKEAGVSIATVSRIVNGLPGAASVETRTRVRQAVERLNYRPNAIARGLSRRRMNTLGVVFASSNDFVLTAHDFYIRILEGILTVGKARQQKTLLFMEDSWQAAERDLSGYTDGQCDGLILFSPVVGEDFYKALRQRNLPVIVTGGASAGADISTVAMDNENAGYLSTKHLLAQGHRRIVHLEGPPNFVSASLRLQGYRRALQESDIPWNKALALGGDYGIESGYARTRALISQPLAERPTALFCADDGVAYGALQALQEAGIQVPQEISVVGVNDGLGNKQTTPPLTSICQPYRHIGSRLAEMLLEEIAQTALPGRHERYPGELIVRSSTAPPRAEIIP